jgi:hypothetical protein
VHHRYFGRITVASGQHGLGQGKTVVCASNLRQIGAAILSYAEENEGLLFPRIVFINGVPCDSKVRAWWGPNGYLDAYLPPRSYAHGGIIGYRENNGVFDCPANSLPCMTPGWIAYTRGEGGYGVVTSGNAPAKGVFYDNFPRNLKSLNRTDYAMVGDTNIAPFNVPAGWIARQPYLHHFFAPQTWTDNGPDPASNFRIWAAYRHSGDSNYAAGGGNYVLVDGSVKYFTYASLLDRTITGQFNYYFMAP